MNREESSNEDLFTEFDRAEGDAFDFGFDLAVALDLEAKRNHSLQEKG